MRKAGTELSVTQDAWNCCAVLKMIVFLFHIFCCFWSMFTGGLHISLDFLFCCLWGHEVFLQESILFSVQPLAFSRVFLTAESQPRFSWPDPSPLPGFRMCPSDLCPSSLPSQLSGLGEAGEKCEWTFRHLHGEIKDRNRHAAVHPSQSRSENSYPLFDGASGEQRK